jgi:hypothetical protein
MKTLEEQNQELVEFDKSFDPNDFESCVNRAILLIKNREAQMIEEGYEWPMSAKACRYGAGEVITNRTPEQTMMSAAIKYVESIERMAEEFNGVN